jgi:hypothetical protein
MKRKTKKNSLVLKRCNTKKNSSNAVKDLDEF